MSATRPWMLLKDNSLHVPSSQGPTVDWQLTPDYKYSCSFYFL